MTGYAFHPEALTDLDQIHDYIAADKPDAADQLVADILSRVRALVSFPQQGRKRPDLTLRPLRFVPVGEYLIA